MGVMPMNKPWSRSRSINVPVNTQIGKLGGYGSILKKTAYEIALY